MRAVLCLAAAFMSFAVCPSSNCFAQNSNDNTEELSTYSLEPVVSTAQRPDTEIVEDVITQDEIDRPSAADTADDLLKGLPGIDIRRTSPSGDTGGTVSIRGFGEGQSLIMLDGRPLNGAGVYGGEYVDWSALSTEDIERIEVVRGAKSAEYGNTLGGIINIVTKRGTAKPKTTVGVSYGSFSTMGINASHSGSYREKLSYNLSLGRTRVDDPFLRNNDLTRYNYSGRVTASLPYRVKLGLRARYTDNDRGFVVTNTKGDTYYDSGYPESLSSSGGGPGIQFLGGEYNWGDGSYSHNIREQYDLDLSRDFGPVSVSGRFYLNDQDRTEYYYDIASSDHLIVKRHAKPEDNTRGWLLKANQKAGNHSLKYGLEGVTLVTGEVVYSHIDTTFFRMLPTSDTASSEENIDRFSAFSEDNWHILESLDVQLGLRYDSFTGHATSDELEKVEHDAVSPKLGLTWRGWSAGTLNLSAGRAIRYPGVPEFYWYYGGYQPADRSSLKPEDAIQLEAGVSQGIADRGRVELRTYHYRVDDYLRVIFGYRPSRVVYNIDCVTLSGLELQGTYLVTSAISLSANYTYQTSEKEGDILDNSMAVTDKLTELPEHKVNVNMNYRHPSGATAELALRYVGERSYLTGSLSQPDAAVLEALDDFVTLDLYGSYPIRYNDRYRTTFRVGLENVLDTEYREIEGYPMPGRMLTVSIDQML